VKLSSPNSIPVPAAGSSRPSSVYSSAHRFGIHTGPTLNPYEKLSETVRLWLDRQISRAEYLEILKQIGAMVKHSLQMLSSVALPEHYDAGAVLGNFAQQGLESFAQSLEDLQQLADQPDPIRAERYLQEAQTAYQSLEELLLEVQTEKGGF